MRSAHSTLLLITTTTAQTIPEPTPTATITPTAPHPPSYTVPEIFQDTVLHVSNSYRRNHNATHLIWNETLSDYAQHWADNCQWNHSVCTFSYNTLHHALYSSATARPVRREPRFRVPQRLSGSPSLGR